MKDKVVSILDYTGLRSELEDILFALLTASVITILVWLVLVAFAGPTQALRLSVVAGAVIGLIMAWSNGSGMTMYLYGFSWASVVSAAFGITTWFIPVGTIMILLVAYAFCLWTYKGDWRYSGPWRQRG